MLAVHSPIRIVSLGWKEDDKSVRILSLGSDGNFDVMDLPCIVNQTRYIRTISLVAHNSDLYATYMDREWGNYLLIFRITSPTSWDTVFSHDPSVMYYNELMTDKIIGDATENTNVRIVGDTLYVAMYMKIMCIDMNTFTVVRVIPCSGARYRFYVSDHKIFITYLDLEDHIHNEPDVIVVYTYEIVGATHSKKYHRDTCFIIGTVDCGKILSINVLHRYICKVPDNAHTISVVPEDRSDYYDIHDEPFYMVYGLKREELGPGLCADTNLHTNEENDYMRITNPIDGSVCDILMPPNTLSNYRILV